ncbi:MAG: HAMP domain-containing histidine kinase [bacterium]|nr:HAMP domain-containing histidine kinase [bacterium]
MNTASLLTVMLGVVALCIATFNGLFFFLRRQERAHLWLAIAAAGMVPAAGFTAALYTSSGPWEAALYRQGSLFSLAVLAWGIARFSEELLEAPLGWLRPALVASIAVLIPVAWMPGVGHTLEPVVRMVPLFGIHYVDTVIALPNAAIAFLAFIPISLIVRHYRRHLPHVDVPTGPVLVATLFWAACAGFEIAVGTGLVEGPFVLVLGYDVFACTFTGLLVGRITRSRALGQEASEELHSLAEARLEAIRQRELQLAHGDRLATVGTLAAGVAHEINNPLAFVSANLNQLEELAKDPNEQDAPALFQEILLETREGLTRISSTVSGLVAMAQREEGAAHAVDLEDVVESVLRLARHQVPEDVVLRTDLDPATPVVGDERLLGQVVLNLLVNAIHAIPENRPGGGQITLRIRDHGERVELAVIDDGTGIPDDVLPLIFDSFFTTKEPGRGTGLGLPVTRQLIARHGGTIDVETNPKGTCMRISLPAALRRTVSTR